MLSLCGKELRHFYYAFKISAFAVDKMIYFNFSFAIFNHLGF